MKNKNSVNKPVNCPVCQHPGHEHLYQVHARYTAEHMYNFAGSEEQVDHLTGIISSMWKNETAEMLKCSNCSLIFADPFIEGSNEFYSAVYQKDNYYPSWKWDYEVTYRDLQIQAESKDLKKARLLEIGAGNGAFVKKLAESSFDKEKLLCTEYSEFGAGQINSMGISCISEPIHVLKTPANKNNFDYICMFQVLEHMDGIQTIFDSVNYLSGKGTILYIAVPSEAYRAFYDRLGRHLDTPPNHLTRWNEKSFQVLAELFGWKVMDHRIQNMPYADKVKRLIFDRLDYHRVFRSSRWTKKKIPVSVKALIVISGLVLGIIYFRSIILLRNKDLGISQWIKLIRE